MVSSKVVRSREPWSADDGVTARRESSLRLVMLALEDHSLDDRHVKELLTLGLWKRTEADGAVPNPKYNVRYVSEAVHRSHGGDEVEINHEHVFTRKSLIQELMKVGPDETAVRQLLDERAVACIVSKQEHALLSDSTASGWDRYRNAGVRVFDRASQQFVTPGSGAGLAESGDAEVAESAESLPTYDSVSMLVDDHVPESIRPLVHRLLDLLDTAGCAAAPHRPRSGEPRWLRLYDTLIEEPTGAVAYLNFNGNIDLALDWDEVPTFLREAESTSARNEDKYSARCRLTSEPDLLPALALVNLALLRLRQNWSNA